MTISEKINKYLRKNYRIEYTVFKTLIIYDAVKVYELVKLRRYLKSLGINYKNIIVKG